MEFCRMNGGGIRGISAACGKAAERNAFDHAHCAQICQRDLAILFLRKATVDQKQCNLVFILGECGRPVDRGDCVSNAAGITRRID